MMCRQDAVPDGYEVTPQAGKHTSANVRATGTSQKRAWVGDADVQARCTGEHHTGASSEQQLVGWPLRGAKGLPV